MFKRGYSIMTSVFALAAAAFMGKDSTPENLVDLRGFGGGRIGHGGRKGRGHGHGNCGLKCWFERKFKTDVTHEDHKRLRPAVHGGNWQGQEYFTYMEHDAITRSYLSMPSIPRDDPFHATIVRKGRPVLQPRKVN